MVFSRLRIASLLLAILAVSSLSLPTARAQATAYYFPATGHILRDDQGFLSFWQQHGGEQLLGLPVSEVIDQGGQPVQYFERARLELVAGPDGATSVQTGRVGTEYAEALWRVFPSAPKRLPAAGELRFDGTGHTLREPFLSFWQSAGGVEMFGQPISEPLWEQTEVGRRQVQYFERARLDRDPAGVTDSIRVGGLGRALALLRQVDLTAVSNEGFETLGPAALLPPDDGSRPTTVPAPTAAPAPTTAPAAPRAPAPAKTQPSSQAAPSSAGKTILVNLSRQWMYAYENGQQVFDAPVTTGRNGMETPTGTYAIYAKLRLQTMDGVLDGVPWVVPNVPDVMYINGGVALHGTYWHNLFGSGVRVSHGCINLPLSAAHWVYGWAPMGTPVTVTY